MKKNSESTYLIGRLDRTRNEREHKPNEISVIMGQDHIPCIRVDKDCEYADIKDGVYLFKTTGFRIITRRGIKRDLQIVEPIKRINAPEDDFWMPFYLKHALSAYPYSKNRIYDWIRDDIHLVMRIYEKHISEVSKFDHTPIGEEKFLEWLFNHLLDTKDSLCEMKSFVDDYKQSNIWDGDVAGIMNFDPRYDKLYPKFIPSFSNDKRYSSEMRSIELTSSDIRSKMKAIFIESDEDIEKYRPYFEDDLEIVKAPSGYMAYYKMPERGSDEYWKILKNSDVQEGFSSFTINSDEVGMGSSITITTPCGKEQIYDYGTDVYADYLKLIGVRMERSVEVLDDDFVIREKLNSSLSPQSLVSIYYRNKYGKFKGLYKASQLFLLKGNCVNANIRKVGSTIDSLRIIIERK